jgi:hypothetical protein
MTTLASDTSRFIKPSSITLVRRDPLPSLPTTLSAKERIQRFIEAVSLVASPRPDKDKFRADATVQQRHVFSYRFTENHVPRGEAITDHSNRRPIGLAFRGWITDTPFLTVGGAIGAGTPGGLPFTNRVHEQLRQLVSFAEAREPLFVATSTFVHPSMAIQSLVMSRTTDTGAAAEISLVMRQIKIVDELRTEPIPDDIAAQLGATPVEVGIPGSTGL